MFCDIKLCGIVTLNSAYNRVKINFIERAVRGKKNPTLKPVENKREPFHNV